LLQGCQRHLRFLMVMGNLLNKLVIRRRSIDLAFAAQGAAAMPSSVTSVEHDARSAIVITLPPA
jgi:hypothetical protein